MRSTLWQLPHMYILIGYSIVVLVGIVLTSASGRVRASRTASAILQPAMLVLALPGPVLIGSFLQAHAFVGFFSWSYSATPEARCQAFEDMLRVVDQLMLSALVCSIVLTLAAVITLLVRRSHAARRGQEWPLAMLIPALLVTAIVLRGPSLRTLLAPPFLDDCLGACKDLPVSTTIGQPAGQIPRTTLFVEVHDRGVLVDYMKIAALEGWDPGFDITGPLAGEIEHRVEMRKALCLRNESFCGFPLLLVGASREAPTSLVAEVARIACSTWKGPCSLVIRTEPVPDTPRNLAETLEAVSRDGRIRCTTECAYALIGIEAAGTAVLPDDPDLTFGDFIAGLEEGTTSVTLPPPEPADEQRTTVYVEKALESLTFPLSEEELRQKLGIPDLEPLSSVDIMDGVVNVLSHSYPLPEDCWLHLDVFRTHPKADWMVSGAKVECHAD